MIKTSSASTSPPWAPFLTSTTSGTFM